jgi:type II secretion system protein G
MWASFKPSTTQKQRGFTIVELLIVIVVIAILATISIVAYSGIQQRARDTIRLSDIKTLSKAIELFYADNGNYPMSNGWCTQPSGAAYAAAFQAEIAPYLARFPRDPSYSGTYQDYFYRNVGDTSYYLYAEMEGSDLADDGFTGCTRTGGLNNEYDYRYPEF